MRNGGRHCCQPPLRRAKDLPVFDLPWSRSGKPVCDPASRSWLTSSGVASHRTAPSCEEPDRSTRLRGPKVRWSSDRSGPASGTEVPRSQNRPMFRGPSWVDPSRVPLRSPDPQSSEENREPGSRVALGEDRLFRRLFPAGPERTRKLFPFPPAEIGPLVTCRALVPLPALGEAGTAVPITQAPCTPRPSRESEKSALSLWKTWIAGTIAETLFESPNPPCFGCRSVPLLLLRPSA
jgi:hypothetical protein